MSSGRVADQSLNLAPGHADLDRGQKFFAPSEAVENKDGSRPGDNHQNRDDDNGSAHVCGRCLERFTIVSSI